MPEKQITTREHVFTSAKGENFLNFEAWIKKTLTEEEYNEFKTWDYTDPRHNSKYLTWLKEEQILTHRYLEDSVEIFNVPIILLSNES